MNPSAAVDMPDAPPPSLAGTDDLLAQLAGDEIDRLLAEAEGDRAAAASASTSTAAPSDAGPSQDSASVSSSGDDDADLDKLLNELAAEAATGETSVPPVTTAAAAVTAAESGVQGAAPAVAADFPSKPRTLTEQVPELLAQHPAPPAPSVEVPADAAAPAPAPEGFEGLMSPAERNALGLSDLAEATDAAEQQDAAVAAASQAAPAVSTAEVDAPTAVTKRGLANRLTPVVRVLEWIDSPLSFVPDGARDVLGKVAIVTLVNSLAVLIYVLFIRH